MSHTPPPDKSLKGSCLCGAVGYEVADAFEYARFCHCSECRRFSGSAFSAFGGITKSKFKLIKGADNVRHYRKSEQTVLGFCEHCGSSLYADKPLRDKVHLRLGTLLDAPTLTPQSHVHVASKAPWYEIADELQQFAAGSGL